MDSKRPNDMQSREAEWIFEEHAVEGLLNDLAFDAELAEYLGKQARSIAASPEKRKKFLELATPWIGGIAKEVLEGEPDWRSLIAVAGFRRMIDRHRQRKIPLDVSAATARELERRMVGNRKKEGQWKFDSLKWMSNHVHRDLLEIGRLQYLPATYGAPYQVYTRRDGREGMAAFPESGLSCSPEGWMEKGVSGFVTHFSSQAGMISGNPVDFETGRIRNEIVDLDAGEYELRLSSTATVLHVHIPSGDKLSASACEDSMRKAEDLFIKCFPEMPWVAWTCTSWLLDRELGRCLPPDSNIVAFGKLFSLLATPGTSSRQIMERVLDSTTDWQTFCPQTSLQKAVLRHLRDGGSFRTTSGFILRD